MKVLLDTNVLLAAFATRGFCFDLLQLVISEHRLVVGENVLEELARALRVKIGMSSGGVAEVVGFLREIAEVEAPSAPAEWPVGDPDDRWVVAAAMLGQVDVVVTGDRDLLQPGGPSDLLIVNPREFWNLVSTGRRPTGGHLLMDRRR